MTGTVPDSAYEFGFRSIEGKPLHLSEFAGRPMLIVNTASKCGFTPQYEGLEVLWRTNRQRGLVVLGVPSNDFGKQEPGNSNEIKNFCQVRYGVDFPLTEKVHVTGPEAHPLFAWIGTKGGFLAKPRWNFYKYLIGPDGSLVNWYSSLTSPRSGRLKRSVERLLKAGPA